MVDERSCHSSDRHGPTVRRDGACAWRAAGVGRKVAYQALLDGTTDRGCPSLGQVTPGIIITTLQLRYHPPADGAIARRLCVTIRLLTTHRQFRVLVKTITAIEIGCGEVTPTCSVPNHTSFYPLNLSLPC